MQYAGYFACCSRRVRTRDRISLWHLSTGAGSDSNIAGHVRLFRRCGVSTFSRQANAWEIARMSRFEIYLLIAPILVVGFGLAMFWLTGWMDRREERRRRAAE